MDIFVGQSAYVSKTVYESEINGFAKLVGDFNSIHCDEEKAKKGIFGKRIAHGMFVASLISTVLGTRLPGEGTVYLEQNIKFKKPIYIGDTVTATVTVAEIINKNKGIYKLNTLVTNQNEEAVMDGYAVVMYKE